MINYEMKTGSLILSYQSYPNILASHNFDQIDQFQLDTDLQISTRTSTFIVRNRRSKMAQKGNHEADLHYVLRVLMFTQAIEVDWYGVAGVTKGPDQDRGPANRRFVSISSL